MNVHPKLVAAGTGGSLAGALTMLVVWLLSLKGIVIPDTAAQGLTIIFSTAIALVAGYLTSSGAHTTVPASPGKDNNMTLIQELGLLEAVAGDVVAFASGQAVNQSVKIAGTAYSVSVVVLPNGPGNYQVFSGSFLSILELVLTDAAAFTSGAPIQIAEKIGNTWYGTTLAKAVPAAA